MNKSEIEKSKAREKLLADWIGILGIRLNYRTQRLMDLPKEVKDVLDKYRSML